MTYEIVMGLEVHIELATASKLFCACSAKFGADANQNVCPACSGMPGLPALPNKKAIELGIAAGLVTNCEITRVTTFDKKNYFYPDLPTGHQITQLFAPICRNGWVEIEIENGKKIINIKQIHLEEDAGKLIHDRRTGTSLIDFNRASVPLVEIVSEPDFRSAEEVIAYLEKLRTLLSFAHISDCKMQEGSMRCDVNISVREAGAAEYGTRTEIKNINSLKAIAAAIGYEAKRHIEALDAGEAIVQETRRWDDNQGETFSMREKEDAADYRYFPNPDILPIVIDDAWIESIRSSLPETAQEKFTRLTQVLGLSDYDSGVICASKNLSALFDETMQYFNNPKEIANWIIVELLSIAKGDNKGAEDIAINTKNFAKLMELVDKKTINRNVAKKMLALILHENIDPEAYVKENSLGMVSDKAVIEKTVREVLAENEKQVSDYKNGNEKLAGFFTGQVMKKLGGKADPQVINGLLKEYLSL